LGRLTLAISISIGYTIYTTQAQLPITLERNSQWLSI